jgi:phospholipid/cholesterol/gamma-HCH transport system permease protein
MAVEDRSTENLRPTPFRDVLEEFGDITRFSGQALKATPSAARFAAETFRQTSILIRGSTFFICALSFFIGFSLINFAFYTLQALGAADYLGLFSGLVTPKFTASATFGYAFAAKVGCGLVAEIGAMRVNEEIDAFESEGVDPMHYVVATRVVAALIFTLIVSGLGLCANLLGAYLDAIGVLHGLEPSSLLRYHWGTQNLGSLVFTLACNFMIAVSIVCICCRYGYRVTGGPAEVGTASARSLVMTIPLVHVILGVAAFAVYGISLGLPIGG